MRDYALEAWRILDPRRSLIHPLKYNTRIWNVPPPGSKLLDAVVGLDPLPDPEEGPPTGQPALIVREHPRAPLVAIVDDRPEVICHAGLMDCTHALTARQARQ